MRPKKAADNTSLVNIKKRTRQRAASAGSLARWHHNEPPPGQQYNCGASAYTVYSCQREGITKKKRQALQVRRQRRRRRARRLRRKAEAENETGIIPPTDVWEQAETLPAAQKETDYRDGSANRNAEGAGLVRMISRGETLRGSWAAAVQLKWRLWFDIPDQRSSTVGVPSRFLFSLESSDNTNLNHITNN